MTSDPAGLKAPKTAAPAAANAAVALVGAFALACFALAVVRRASWDDVLFFSMLGVMAANVAHSLVIRERWAWVACCWIAAIAAINFGLLGTLVGVWIAMEAAGLGQGFVIVTSAKVLFWVVWMLLLVVIPAAVLYSLTRPAARDWFSPDPSG